MESPGIEVYHWGSGGDGAIDTLIAIVQALGGVGLFLLGMIILTDGLRDLAGDAMRASLARFTRSPLSGAITGFWATALLQSSSVTTLAAVGFVGAGLLTFPQALGVVLGANVGTTLTGWIVALVGFKLNLGGIIAPFIAVGVLMRLFGQDRTAASGFALAGFGVVFVGLEAMQAAMAGLEDVVTPARLPGPAWSGTLVLLAAGALITVVTQSSTAGVAAAITAIHADAISFHQAAALVVGMNLGTTVTAAIATIGGSVAVRRTGFSHVVFNVIISAAAVLMIGPFIRLCDIAAPNLIRTNAEIGLVLFHTAFNLLGVAAVLPMARPFARLIERIVPERPALYRRNLDTAFLEDANMALNAVQDAVQMAFVELLHHINALLGEPTEARRAHLKELGNLLEESHGYMDRIRLALQEGPVWDRYIALLHALDHLQRLHARCEDQEHRAATVRTIPELAEESVWLSLAVKDVIQSARDNRWYEADKRTAEVLQRIYTAVEPFREAVITRIARDEISSYDGTRSLDAIRWLQRVSQHVDKITRYLSKAMLAAGS